LRDVTQKLADRRQYRALVAALCCSTPLLVLLLGAVGLSALTGAIDYVAIPALVIFIGIIIYALWQRRSA